jgi:hypothetical protein
LFDLSGFLGFSNVDQEDGFLLSLISHKQIPSLYLFYLLCFFYTVMLLQENLQQWLTDEKARDQFVIRAGSDTEVLWNDARHLKPEPVYKRAVSRSSI